MELEIAKDTQEKIEGMIAGGLDACRKDIAEAGGFQPMGLMFDDQARAIPIPMQIQTFLDNPPMKDMFVPIMKRFKDFLRDRENINIISFVLFQSVYYAQKNKGEFEDQEDYIKKHGSVSQDPDAEEAVMIIQETKTQVHTKVFPAIYDDKGTTGVVSETAIQDMVFDKNDKEHAFQSWMIGVMD